MTVHRPAQRVLVLSYYYAPEQTGIAVYSTGMCRYLHQLGWEVEAVTGTPHYPWWKAPAPYDDARWWKQTRGVDALDGVELLRIRHHIAKPPLSGLKRMGMEAVFLARATLRLFAMKRRPHAVLAVAPPFLLGLVARLHAWRWRVPMLYHVQDLQVDAARELGMLPGPLCAVLATIERLVLRSSDLVTTISLGMRRRIEAKGPLRRPVGDFPNWADTASMRQHAGPNSYRQDWGVPPGALVVAYSGNLGRKQGLDLLLEAFSLLRDRPDLRFIIAGEGAERQQIEAEVSRLGLTGLSLLPLAPAARLAEFLSAADMHCIPQRRGAADTVMPSKLLNLMSTSRPVLATADPGTSLHQMVTTSGCGLALPPEDPVALAAGIRRLADDPALRQRSGAAGRSWVCAHLSRHAVLSKQAARIRFMSDRMTR